MSNKKAEIKKGPEVKSVPAGWALLAEGQIVKAGDKVCAHPFRSWRLLDYTVGAVRSRNGRYIPEGYYIRRKPVKKPTAKKK